MATVHPENTGGVLITGDNGDAIVVSYGEVPDLISDLETVNSLIVPNVPIDFSQIREALSHYEQSDRSAQAGSQLASAIDRAIFRE
jgi:hypothetical protein